MLTLIRGKSRKSEYMQLLHNGDKHTLFLQYGQDIPTSLIDDDKEDWVFDRSKETYHNVPKLRAELLDLFDHIRVELAVHTVYLYGNFEVIEIPVLSEVAKVMKGWNMSIVASIQDNEVPDGKIIIEEIR